MQPENRDAGLLSGEFLSLTRIGLSPAEVMLCKSVPTGSTGALC